MLSTAQTSAMRSASPSPESRAASSVVVAAGVDMRGCAYGGTEARRRQGVMAKPIKPASALTDSVRAIDVALWRKRSDALIHGAGA